MRHDPAQLLAVALRRVPHLTLLSKLALAILNNLTNIVGRRPNHLHEVAPLCRILLLLNYLLPVFINLVFHG